MSWTSQKLPQERMDCSDLHIASLNSGSNGNCYYVGNRTEAVLIDAGISCREIEKRMLRLGLSLKKVKALFISHEHSDHIKGVCVLAKKYQLPVYITPGTLRGCRFDLDASLIRHLDSHSTHQFGSLLVKSFPKIHDAAEPHSFTVSCGDTRVGVFTDLGAVCNELSNHFRDCHAAFLEANYDEDLLNRGNYPYFLKRRISGGNGHLSNRQALQLFLDHRPPYMSHLLLSHLSKDNNDPQVVQELFELHAGETKIIVASRYEETDVHVISSVRPASGENVWRNPPGPPLQYSLEV